jgi:hypothetical protein
MRSGDTVYGDAVTRWGRERRAEEGWGGGNSDVSIILLLSSPSTPISLFHLSTNHCLGDCRSPAGRLGVVRARDKPGGADIDGDGGRGDGIAEMRLRIDGVDEEGRFVSTIASTRSLLSMSTLSLLFCALPHLSSTPAASLTVLTAAA